MIRTLHQYGVNKLEQEIIRKERLAFDAKQKGMLATFSNYMTDVSVLKTELNLLRTSPKREHIH